MDHLPNGKYPVKEVKVFEDNYIFILPNDLMVHTHAPEFKECSYMVNIRSINIQDGTITIYIRYDARHVRSLSSNYQVVHTKEDIVEKLI